MQQSQTQHNDYHIFHINRLINLSLAIKTSKAELAGRIAFRSENRVAREYRRESGRLVRWFLEFTQRITVSAGDAKKKRKRSIGSFSLVVAFIFPLRLSTCADMLVTPH